MKVALRIGVLLQVMACTEPPPGLPIPVEEAPEREWVGLNARPCAVDTVGDVRCWNSEIWEEEHIEEYHNGVRIRDLFLESSSALMGIDADDQMRLLFCENPEVRQCIPLPGTFASAGFQIGLRYDGSLVFGEVFEPEGLSALGPTDIWLAVSRSGPIAVNARNQLVIPRYFDFGDRPWSELLYEDRTYDLYLPGRPIAVVGAHGYTTAPYLGGCVLDDTGVIACAGNTHWTSMRFENGPYRWLDGGGGTACAVRAVDHVIECNDGSTYDWGPLIDFAAYGYPYRDEDGFWTSGWEVSPSVCAITLANEIKCAGPRYGDDLLEALEETNDRNRRSLPLGLWGLPW